ncbi:hypothetical protein F2Q68_00044713 [Brassica cretica]|uniref:Uncharacterized protein n=1 Tax=Brassica cretica TaxID=69181 RepID=A0A8S9LUX4_BRACR|nr:hypothetical protein F2Q68_00044713 [Brassica cretica]
MRVRVTGEAYLLVRHPTTIAYPEKFFESAQAIAVHSHLRWPDISREWIRRQQARIARVDWESRLPCVHGPRTSRLSLFTRKQQKFSTRKQQKLLNKAREMDGVPDLSALLKRKLQLLSKKPSSTSAPETVEPIPTDEDVNVEPSVPHPKKKTTKKTKAKKTSAEENQSAPHDENASLEGNPSSAEASKDLRKKKKKKKGGKKRSREESAGEREDLSRRGHRRLSMGPFSSDDARGGGPSSKSPSEKGKGASASGSEPRGESVASDKANSAASDKTTPVSVARGRSQSRGSLAKRARVEFPDRVQFSYDKKTPLVFNPLQCAELTRQIRGGTRELPPIGDLYFKDEYIDAAFTRTRSDGSMNYLVEKYDSALKQTMIQLGDSEKLARARLGAIERMRAENKKDSDKVAEEKEVL